MLRIFQHHKKNKWRSRFEAAAMGWRNRFSEAPLVQPGGVSVSLTTFLPRIPVVHIAIESIGRGSEKPGELILWMDEKHRGERLPKTLQRLVARGLTIRYCEDLGPHKKYYPFVHSRAEFEQPLVTADDDVIYPDFWLSALVGQYRRHPLEVHCFRAHRIVVREDQITPYDTWPPCQSMEADIGHFATGVSGVLYPPAFLRALKEQGDRFREVCPYADDIWLNVNALRHGFPIRQVCSRPVHFAEVRRTQQSSLNRINVKNGGNDAQIRSTYGPSDVALLNAGHLPGALTRQEANP